MAINKKLIHFNTLSNFQTKLDGREILDTSIVFIKDAKLIWTHGQYYGYDSISGDLKDRLDNIEEIIEENEFVIAKALTELEETKANISDTLEGYGITDAYTKEEIDNKNFYVKPDSGITKDDLSDSIRISLENADNYKGTVTGVKINNETTKNPTSGIVNLEISKSTVGLGNVDNTADSEKSVKSAISAEKDSKGNIISETYAKSASLKAVATSGSYNDLTDKPESLKNPESLTIQANGTTLDTYDGSSAKTINITASDLGLSSALKYCGITTTTLTDGASTNPVKINNTDHTATQGCVVFYGDKEFIFNGSIWEEFGYPVDMSSYATTTWVDTNYKPKQISVSSPTASGNTTAFIDTISQNANGVISVTKKNVDFSNYLKKTEATGANVFLSSSYVPAVFPEDTGVGEFTSLSAGESLDSAISKLDQNIAELVLETLDNEEVISAAFADINNKLAAKEIFSDDPQLQNITIGGNPVYKKVISLEYSPVTLGTEMTWEIPCSNELTGVTLLEMSCILTQIYDKDGAISFDYRDNAAFNKNSNNLVYFYKHNTGNLVIRFSSSVETTIFGTILFSTPNVIDGGDGAAIINEDIIDGGTCV